LLCRFCWVRDPVMLHPADIGKFYTPKQVADSLVVLARRSHFSQLRISGGEPTIGKAHLLQLLDRLAGEGFSFILETNGIPIALDEGYARSLSKYDFIHVRVSLKGCNGEEFSILTGAQPEGFRLQLLSLERLSKEGISCHPAMMTSFSSKEHVKKLTQNLKQACPDLAEELEIEELILYPHVLKRIKRYGLTFASAHEPSKVPSEQI
jgi:uncharacterized Fe-S cluster-containing radical SAM superfamily protein